MEEALKGKGREESLPTFFRDQRFILFDRIPGASLILEFMEYRESFGKGQPASQIIIPNCLTNHRFIDEPGTVGVRELVEFVAHCLPPFYGINFLSLASDQSTNADPIA